MTTELILACTTTVLAGASIVMGISIRHLARAIRFQGERIDLLEAGQLLLVHGPTPEVERRIATIREGLIDDSNEMDGGHR